MTAPILKRIEALESSPTNADQNHTLVFANDGETAEEAKQREGIKADAMKVIVVTFV